MKKTLLTIAIVLGLSMTTFADGGGLFQRGTQPYGWRTGGEPAMPALPDHESDGNQDAPLGTGIAIMTALGAAYLIGKRRKED